MSKQTKLKKMKLITLLFAFMLFLGSSLSAQLKKDGTPDMRYNSNKQSYGNNSVTPKTSTNSNTDIRYQNSYTKSDGTNVKSHYKTDINKTNTDNFSTKDNYNYTNGTTGTKAKDYSSDAQNYGSGKTIQTGPNGGQYYINSNGNKTYVR